MYDNAIWPSANLPTAGTGITRGPTDGLPGNPTPRDAVAPGWVAAQIATALRPHHDRAVELTLSPEELGVVRMSLSATDSSAVLIVTAERPETLDLMRRNVDALERQFREMGFQNLSFSFTDGQPDRRQRNEAQRSTWSEAGADDRPVTHPAGPATARPGPAAAPDGRLYLRL
ncbi:MAG: flagellar hook-length control protein FliK [Pseudomonadota bacterium]